MIRKTIAPFSRISIWLYIQIDIQIGIHSTTCSEKRQYHFLEYRSGSIFKSLFKSVFALLDGQKDNSTILPNIDLALNSNRYSLYNMFRKKIVPFSRISIWLYIQIDIEIGIRSTRWSERQQPHLTEYRPGTKFKSIFKSGFALLHDKDDDSTLFTNIDLALYSNRYSNRYLLYYMFRKKIAPFSRISIWLHIQIDIQIGIRYTTWSERQQHHFTEYRPGTKFKSIFKSGFALLHDQEGDITIFTNIDLALYSNRYSLYYMVRTTIAPFYRISTWH